jgi:hypothetical protein
VLPLAFEFGFGGEECLASWRKVRVTPLTWECLRDPRVARAIGDGDDEYRLLLVSIQEANEYSVYTLMEGGYKGSALQACSKQCRRCMC